MSSPKKRSHARAAGQTGITISVPTTLVEDIDLLAKDDNRNRSNWIVNELHKAVAAKKAQLKLLKGAEDAAKHVEDKPNILAQNAGTGNTPFTDSTRKSQYPKGGETLHAHERETLPLAAEKHPRAIKPKTKA